MNRAVKTATFLLCAAGLTVLAACGGPTAGEPAPADREPSRETSEDPPPSAETEDDYSAADLCGLLEPDEAVEMGGGREGETAYSTTNAAELCRWSDAMSLVVGLQQGANIAGVKSGPDLVVTPTDVDGVPAVRKVTPSLDSCEILIDLPDNNLFGASVAPLSAGKGKYDPCTVAADLASITVPRVTDD